MKIGVDIDGVLTNIIQYLLDYSSKYFYEKYGKLEITPNVYSLSEMFNVSYDDAVKCYISALENYATYELSRPYASEVIKKLKNEGNEIYIISSRCIDSFSMLNGKMPDLIKAWLDNNDIYYDKIFLAAKDKLKICLENNVDIMIDDYEENIKKVSTKIPVICYNAGHNVNCNGNNIYRAYSWYHVYEIIKNHINI